MVDHTVGVTFATGREKLKVGARCGLYLFKYIQGCVHVVGRDCAVSPFTAGLQWVTHWIKISKFYKGP